MIGMITDDPKNARAYLARNPGLDWLQAAIDPLKAATFLPSDRSGHFPSTIVLIGPDGKILAKDLRGSEIESAVARALAPP